MQDLLQRYPAYFPKRYEQFYTLKEYFDETINDAYQLPMIVNIVSLNNDGRPLKPILTKNTPLLLIKISQIESILAEYHRPLDGRHHSSRHRFNVTPAKFAKKSSPSFRGMRKFSKSLASLTTINQINDVNKENDNNNNVFDGDDSPTCNQRDFVKGLNMKRLASSSIPLCRIPMKYQRYFELLNEDDRSIEPFHKLTDLIITERDDKDPDKRIEKWPQAFFLRSSCTAYKKKNLSDFLHMSINDQKTTNRSVSTDSTCTLSTDLDSQNDTIILDDHAHILQAGQILNILGLCLAFHTRISEKETKEQRLSVPQPPSPSLSYFSPSWIRDKSRLFFSKKHRQSQPLAATPNEVFQNKVVPRKLAPHLKCQTEEGEIVYISVQESGLFSPLNTQIKPIKPNTESTRLDISGVFQINNLLSNFRLPISVRHLDGAIVFDNIFTPPTINRTETPTKLRLLMQYNEQIVYACPINLVPSKSSKTTSPYFIIPISVNADIQIQPCQNMHDICQTEDFHKLMETCLDLIEQYQSQISLIHFPLQLTNNNNNNDPNRKKSPLFKKRSQSETFVDHFDQNMKSKFCHSDEQLNYSNHNSSSPVSSPLRYRDSLETVKQKLSTDIDQSNTRHSSYYGSIEPDKQNRCSVDEYTSEDEIYRDVDKIYDYIRSGDITDDVQQIQARAKSYNQLQEYDPRSNVFSKNFERTASGTSGNSGQMMTHHFTTQMMDPVSSNDRNVDEDEAHALFLASKQRTKDNLLDLPNTKPITKMKRIDKH